MRVLRRLADGREVALERMEGDAEFLARRIGLDLAVDGEQPFNRVDRDGRQLRRVGEDQREGRRLRRGQVIRHLDLPLCDWRLTRRKYAVNV